MGSILAAALMREQPPSKYYNQFQVPLPDPLHGVLQESAIQGRQVLVVGDVHGCLDELKNLLATVHFTPEEMVVVFCGDIINRGPKNVETLSFVRSLGSAVYAVRGNHEDKVIREWLDYNQPENGHPKHVLSAKFEWVAQLTREDIDFLISLPYTLSIPSLDTMVLHAGLDPWKPLHHQQPIDLILTRNILNPDDSHHRLTESIREGLPWVSCWPGPTHIYFGHDARRGLQQRRFATGLDTGCVYGSYLTGALLTKNQGAVVRTLVAVQAQQAYKEKSPRISLQDYFFDS